MTRTTDLGGSWTLTFQTRTTAPAASLEDARRRGYAEIPAVVPGNVETDLMRAGLLPDLYSGDGITAAWGLEYGDWWYSRTFEWDEAEASEDGFEHVLCFDGIDTVAEVWLNGVHVGDSANMLIAHEFPAIGLQSGGNEIVVHISSALRAAAGRDYAPLDDLHEDRFEGAWVRKAPHSYGWDIAPRLVSHGIWRAVALVTRPVTRFADVYLQTKDLDLDRRTAKLDLFYRVLALPEEGDRVLRVCAVRRGAGSLFAFEQEIGFEAGRARIPVEDAAFWWPRGYGDPDLYDVTVELLIDGAVADTYGTTLGIRIVEVDTGPGRGRWPAEVNVADPAQVEDFRVRVNGVPVFLTGTNWVPLDALHSRDAERLPAALALLDDVGGNVVRCWGGNVYEANAFYDACDELGILVWQDFALACGRYPQTDEFAALISTEAEAVVRRLRNHPSLFLWCGNNENDQFWARDGFDPNNDRIAREVLRRVVMRHDPYSFYLPSSPFYSSASFQTGRALPEAHLWGARASFKTPFYADHGSAFVSEIGYHGAVARRSLRRFLPADRLDPDPDDELWQLHDTLHTPPSYERPYRRIQLMIDQATRLFRPATTPQRFVQASQIAQAEAKKFFVESARSSPEGRQSGVIWWNLLDCWPQISDAVVDYFFERKLAYYYLRVSQQPVLIAAKEAEGWRRRIIAINHTRADVALTLSVDDLDSGKVLWSGEIRAPAGAQTLVTTIPIALPGPRCLALRWTSDSGDRFGLNHYVEGDGALDLDRYLAWLAALAAGYGIEETELWPE